MRMLLIALLCILVVIGIWCAFYYMSIENAIPKLTDGLNTISEQIEDDRWNDAQLTMTKSLNEWNDIEKLWVYCVHQNDIDEIEARYLMIDKYIKTRWKPQALSEIEYLKVYLRKIKGNESLSLENVF